MHKILDSITLCNRQTTAIACTISINCYHHEKHKMEKQENYFETTGQSLFEYCNGIT
jgi:hypothetical protein